MTNYHGKNHIDFVYNKVVRFVRIFIVLDSGYLVNYRK